MRHGKLIAAVLALLITGYVLIIVSALTGYSDSRRILPLTLDL